MADKKDPKSPATTSAAYDAMVPRWALIEALLGGTESMRAAGQNYLPQHSEETDANYAERLAVATLLNITEQTLDTLASKPFTEPMKLDEVPKQIEDLLDDIDLQGNDLNTFCRKWFREGMAKTFAHVLVDMPRVVPRADGQPRTVEDDRKENIRPYWIAIKPEQVLFAMSEIIAGEEVLKHVRILECNKVRDGFSEVFQRQIRILEPGHVEIWKPKPRKVNQKEEWYKAEEWETALDYIPLRTFYADREDFMYGKPPLLDLAYMNVAHWQSTADQRHILKVTRFPILACSGDDGSEAPITIGPNKVLYTSEATGKFYYVEHTGAAIEAGNKDLEDLERQMSGYGAEFLEEDPGNPTATAKAIDTAESASSLSSMAMRFEDAVAGALSMTADWLKIDNTKAGTVEVVKDYTPEMADLPGLDALDKARTRRDISREAYLNGLIKRGVLPEDFDMEADQALIQDEADSLAATMIDLAPGSQLPKPGEPTPPGKLPPEPGTPPIKPGTKKPPVKKPGKK